MPASNYTRNLMRRHIFGSASFPKPAQLWFGLFTTQLDASGAGTEVVAPSYARVQRNPDDANYTFSGTNLGEVTNTSDVLYNAPQEPWGDVLAVGAFDASVAGNLIGYTNFTQPKTINAGDSAPKIGAGLFKAIFS